MSNARNLANLIGNINAGGGGVNRNVVINGAMNVSQRSTSVTGLGNTADSYPTLDRFKLSCDTGAATAGRLTMSQDSSAPSGFANSLKLACTTADTSIAAGELCALFQPIEGQNLQAFAKGTSDAKPFAVSFYVKGNASATYMLELKDTDNTRLVHRQFSVTTDWTRIEVSFPKDTTGAFDDDNAKSLELRIFLHAGSNYTSGTYTADTWAGQTSANRAVGISSFFDSTDRTFFITGVQLEVGQNATEFESEPIARTLEKCQRYLHKIVGNGSAATSLGMGASATTTTSYSHIEFPVTMRSAPALTGSGFSTSDNNSYNVSGTGIAINTAESQTLGCSRATIIITVSSGLTALRTAENFLTASTSSHVTFDSEL